jgi:fused signal recognition particle receptor
MAEEEKKEKKGFFRRLWSGLSKTRNSIVSGLENVFTSSSKIDEDFYEELEEILIMGDLGVSATDEILEKLRTEVKEQHIKEPAQCRDILIRGIREQMTVDEHAYDFEEHPSVVLVIGVNGVGKTTSIGKLAGIYQQRGKKVLIAAADTFRAAAVDQLKIWADRAGVDLITGAEGADPASVVFDALQAAKARHTDILLVDTAGRLHNKKNLMQELAKIDRVITREYPDCIRENLVVLDGTTGQNALSQAREFAGVTNLTGIILTKMDGTAKGGIAIAVQSELKIPVKFIGIGEQIDDLQRFEPDAFVDALFDVTPQEAEEESTAEESKEETSPAKEAPKEEESQTTESGETPSSEEKPKNWWDDIDDTPIFREHGDYY